MGKVKTKAEKVEATETAKQEEVITATKVNEKEKAGKLKGRKFSVKNLKPYERKAYNFIREMYPQYDVEKFFEEEVRIHDGKTHTKKFGQWQQKYKLITMFFENIEKNSFQVYSRSSAHLMAPGDGLDIDIELHKTLVFIHEMTHAMQYLEGINYNEVDTVRNEIEYLRINHVDIYQQLVPSQTRPLYRTGQVLEITNGKGQSAKFKIKNTIWFSNKLSWRYYLVQVDATDGIVVPVFEAKLEPNVTRIFKAKRKEKNSNQTVNN